MLSSFAAIYLKIASQEQLLRFADLHIGYITVNGIQGTQFAFFQTLGFDPALLDLAEASKQTITIDNTYPIPVLAMPQSSPGRSMW